MTGSFRRLLRNFRRMAEGATPGIHCPRCNRPMSQWFLWHGLTHCYPCYMEMSTGDTILENGISVPLRGETCEQIELALRNNR